MPTADPGRRRAGRTVVKKRGVLAPLLFPIGIAGGLVIVGSAFRCHLEHLLGE